THKNDYINSYAITLGMTLTMLIATVIGGQGTSYGPLISTLITLMIAELIASLYDVSFLVNGLILLSVLLLFPQGAIGLVQKVAALFRVAAHDSTPEPARSDAARVFAQVAPPASAGPMLVIENLTKSYGGVMAVSDVSL